MRNSVRAFFKFSSNPLVGWGSVSLDFKDASCLFRVRTGTSVFLLYHGRGKIAIFFQNTKIFIDKKKRAW